MSIQALTMELESRSGPALFPSSFPIDLLIGLTRALALVADCSVPNDELTQIFTMMKSYLRRIVSMQGRSQLEKFDGQIVDLIEPLVQEVYESMCDEIISKLIGYNISKVCLRDRFLSVLDGEEVTQ